MATTSLCFCVHSARAVLEMRCGKEREKQTLKNKIIVDPIFKSSSEWNSVSASNLAHCTTSKRTIEQKPSIALYVIKNHAYVIVNILYANLQFA